jgi:aspartyl aminopeptidase
VSITDSLQSAGFERLDERSSWNHLSPGGRYYFTRNQSSLIAFAVGDKWMPGNGILVTGAHTDSPHLKVKARSNVRRAGYQLVSVEIYGGALLHTWWDRDLGVAGRVVVRDAKTGELRKHLVNVNEPIMRLSTLAIHLNREVNSEGFKFNHETHMHPILCTLAADTLNAPSSSSGPVSGDEHPPALLTLLASRIGCSAAEIVDFDLALYDVQPSTVGGLHREFIFSARIDNLLSCFCGTEGLIDSVKNQASSDVVRMIALFDHEECGSQSAHGADSAFLPDTIHRMLSCLNRSAADKEKDVDADLYMRSIARSMVLSADCAHGVHPNYADKHHENMKPMLNAGVVLKLNNNQRYATNDATMAAVLDVAQRARGGAVPMQVVQVRNDSACGTTIGPILHGKVACKSVDIGAPQLSMHSCREQCGTADVSYLTRLIESFMSNYSVVEEQLSKE